MRLIARSNLLDYAAGNPQAKPALVAWIVAVRAATWTSMAEVLASVPSAKALNGERARFEIRGGRYRLIVAFHFRRQIAFVKFVGTHAEYDAVDALTISQF